MTRLKNILLAGTLVPALVLVPFAGAQAQAPEERKGPPGAPHAAPPAKAPPAAAPHAAPPAPHAPAAAPPAPHAAAPAAPHAPVAAPPAPHAVAPAAPHAPAAAPPAPHAAAPAAPHAAPAAAPPAPHAAAPHAATPAREAPAAPSAREAPHAPPAAGPKAPSPAIPHAAAPAAPHAATPVPPATTRETPREAPRATPPATAPMAPHAATPATPREATPGVAPHTAAPAATPPAPGTPPSRAGGPGEPRTGAPGVAPGAAGGPTPGAPPQGNAGPGPRNGPGPAGVGPGGVGQVGPGQGGPGQQGNRGGGISPGGAAAIGAAAGFAGGFLAATGAQRLDQIRGERQQSTEGGRTFIREPGRTIVEEDGRAFIVHDENERFRELGYNVRRERSGPDFVDVIDRPGGIQILTFNDPDGRMLRRVRRYPDGREVVLIDNGSDGRVRPYDADVVVLPPPPIGIPPDQYDVDYGRVDEGVIYDTLSAPPLQPPPQRYTLDQIRYSPDVRRYVRSVDINTINFDSGSWIVPASATGKLQALATAIKRTVDRNPNSVFLVEGFTDATGNPTDNLSLSDRRAQSVAAILSKDFGVPPENITTQGYGQQNLKVNTPGPSAANRRVVVQNITPLLAAGGAPPK